MCLGQSAAYNPSYSLLFYPTMLLVAANIPKFIMGLSFPTDISMTKAYEYWGIQMKNASDAATSNQQWGKRLMKALRIYIRQASIHNK